MAMTVDLANAGLTVPLSSNVLKPVITPDTTTSTMKSVQSSAPGLIDHAKLSSRADETKERKTLRSWLKRFLWRLRNKRFLTAKASNDARLGGTSEILADASESSGDRTEKEKDNSQLNLFEQSIATIRSTSLKKSKSKIHLLDESWEDWLEKYQKGDINISDIGRPTSFGGFGHMAPPLFRYEAARLKAVDKVADPNLWKAESAWLNTELTALLARYRLKCVTVSLIEKTAQRIVFQSGLGEHFRTFSRDISIDAHTILSSEYFGLLDCSSDWRTRLNPLVHGPPFVKFYLGVKIMFDRVPIGCIALSDPYVKVKIDAKLISELNDISRQLTAKLEKTLNMRSATRMTRVVWDEDDIAASIMTSESDASSATSVVTTQTEAQAQSEVCLPIADLIPQFSATCQPIFCKSVMQPFEVFESLLRCKSVPQAIKKACRIIKNSLGVNIVYLAEVASSTPLSLAINQDEADNGSLESLISNAYGLGSSTSEARLVGQCTPDVSVDMTGLVKSHKLLLERALVSNYGLEFTNVENRSSTFDSGLVMPLRRREVPSGDQKNHNSVMGGFTVTAIHRGTHSFFSPGDQAFMKKVVRALENILTCYDELTSKQDIC